MSTRASRDAAAIVADAVSPPKPGARIPESRTSSPSAVMNPPPSTARAKLTTRVPDIGHSAAFAAARLAAVDGSGAIPKINAVAASAEAQVPVHFGRTLMDGRSYAGAPTSVRRRPQGEFHASLQRAHPAGRRLAGRKWRTSAIGGDQSGP